MRKHSLNVIVLVIATLIFVMAQWQHELLVIGYIWSDPQVYNRMFQWCSTLLIRTTIGQAYDLTLLLVAFALVLSDLALWFWNDAPEVAKREEV